MMIEQIFQLGWGTNHQLDHDPCIPSMGWIWNFQGHHETCSLLRVRSTSAQRNETGGTVMWNGDGQEKTHAIFEKVRGHQSWPLGSIYGYLGGGFKYFLFSPLFGEDEPILTSIFFRWVVQPPTRYSYLLGDSIRNLFLGPGEWIHVTRTHSKVVGWNRMASNWDILKLRRLNHLEDFPRSSRRLPCHPKNPGVS